MIFFARFKEKTPIERIKRELKNDPGKPAALNYGEALLVRQIRHAAAERNTNNVTRTKAYWDFYRLHPEIHWAFLGHMVSRNGGWNMTDLKGELLARLLSGKEKRSFFSFLERGNWLIFQDVYPQMLLYHMSMQQGRPLFHLLPYLQVSCFMEVIWNDYWEYRNDELLAIAMVINEQSYLEKRVIQNPVYQKEVFKTIEFKLQDIFSFNQILFPYEETGGVQLAGQTLHQFGSLQERILLGKRLYAILLGDRGRLERFESWAQGHPHTGSRKDYWPQMYNNIHEGLPGKYQLKLRACKLKPGARRIYSPALENAWKNASQPDAEEGDWYEDWHVAEQLEPLHEPIQGEIMNEYCKTLERLERAALAKKALSLREA
ncbi:DUF2515 domain-containing protein [Heyndrickxia acidiproducens]|uniref:DUF2515 domain-containing protein n=1 Tax=Heyndrickxia acidiproducens TaxID=1121084 RepID=UPI000374297B|nr:DUF2515 domain-containing protein [Heyndrickxia acidiproducens]